MTTGAERASAARGVLALCVAAAAMAAGACGGASHPGARAPGEVRGVEAADLPYRVLRAHGGQEISWSAFLAELDRTEAVCVGENHRNPHDHWAQLQLVDQLTARNRKSGVATALGMEMFQRPFQGVLDDFAARRIDEGALLSRSGWKDRWGFDWSLYRPMVLMARDRGAAILALNTPRELTKKVSRRGIDHLDPGDRRQLPEMVLDDAEHRAWWDATMEEMGGAPGHSSSSHGDAHGDAEGDDDQAEGQAEGEGEEASGHHHHQAKDSEQSARARARARAAEEAESKAASERIYAAQVLWDESMADGASAWLAAGKQSAAASPSEKARRQIIILAGNGHCHESAIVRRIERRGVPAAVSVRPVIDDGEGSVAELLAAPENDYLFVMTPPAR
ncbi:MAG TPA: ChaN family lipoprotein [Kofleriaceae bacterium]|nr:ChaN family lipoprotein [Kofleriaceae bacterium]